MTRQPRHPRLIATLRRRGLTAPIAMLAAMHRPLSPLLSDLATLASPLVEPLVGRDRVANLTSEEGLDAMLAELSSGAVDDERTG
jgi:hypothetical protein